MTKCKISKQIYDLQQIEEATLCEEAELTQRLIKTRPLFECRQYDEEVTHWEFYNWKSFTSSMEGLFDDEEICKIEDWAKRIHAKAGYSYEILLEVLSFFAQYKVDKPSYYLK